MAANAGLPAGWKKYVKLKTWLDWDPHSWVFALQVPWFVQIFCNGPLNTEHSYNNPFIKILFFFVSFTQNKWLGYVVLSHGQKVIIALGKQQNI
jgi:hypothetical protein